MTPPPIVATGQVISAAYANATRTALIALSNEQSTWTSNVAAAGRNLTGAGLVSAVSITATGAVTGTTGSFSGAVSVGSVTASGAVGGATGSFSGAVGVGSLSSSGLVSATAITVTGAVTGATGVFSSSVGVGFVGTPGLRIQVHGISGAPALSGTAQTGIARFSQASGAGVLDFGFAGTAGGGAWLQSTSSLDLSQKFSLILNPRGGHVAISCPASATPVTEHFDGSMSCYIDEVNHRLYFLVRESTGIFKANYLQLT